MSKRTFIAIKINPTEELLRRIYFLKSHLKNDQINWIKDQNFHITLRFIGNTPTDLLEKIAKDLENQLSNYKEFEIILKGIFIFGSKHSPKVIWVGVEPVNILSQMASDIDRILLKDGFERDRQNFVPHLSLARIKKLGDKNYFHQVLQKADQSIIQSEKIGKILFYESILKSTGAEYSILREINLNR